MYDNASLLVDGRKAFAYIEVDLEHDRDWLFETDSDDVGGPHAAWGDLDFSGPMELAKLARDDIRIRAKTYDDGKDILIGKAVVPGIKFTENCNRIVEVVGTLSNKEGDAECGKFSLRGRFREELFGDSGYLDVNTIDISHSNDICKLSLFITIPYYCIILH